MIYLNKISEKKCSLGKLLLTILVELRIVSLKDTQEIKVTRKPMTFHAFLWYIVVTLRHGST